MDNRTTRRTVCVAGKLRDGRLSGRPAGGVPAVQIVGLSVYVGVRAQRDHAQRPAAVDVQRRGRDRRRRIVAIPRRWRVAAEPAQAAPSLRARPVRGQHLPAQGTI